MVSARVSVNPCLQRIAVDHEHARDENPNGKLAPEALLHLTGSVGTVNMHKKIPGQLRFLSGGILAGMLPREAHRCPINWWA
jgi:hypothetical protein